ncbi:MAG: VWA domain-containing protein, partial [Lachnospiraceae bacterium]|nr:VWA domain-containing protein [Lachnospiraceae bacterium]
MREKKSIKRAIALILAAVLAFTTFSSDITAIAAPSGNDSNLSVSTTTKDGIKLTKTAALNDDGTVNITFKVDGNSATQYTNTTKNTDVVLVLDTSNSMTTTVARPNTRIMLAKAAAKDFVNKIFDADEKGNVRIGVVSFNDGRSTVSDLVGKASRNNLLNSIEKMGTKTNTLLQGGIKQAEELFGANNDNNKI